MLKSERSIQPKSNLRKALVKTSLFASFLVACFSTNVLAQVVDQEPTIKFESEPNLVPICNDAKPVGLQEFVLEIDRPQTLTEVSIATEGTTTLTDIGEIWVSHRTETKESVFAKTTTIQWSPKLRGRLELTEGKHRFQVWMRSTKNADLLHKIAINVASISFDGGPSLAVDKKEWQPTQRLAYPIHRRGDFDCHTFRIPGVARANNGDLLAVYDMRYNSRRDLQEHIDIGLSRSRDGGQTWQAPIPIMDMGEFGGKPQKENGCSDPCILVDQNTGQVFVAACWTYGKPNTHQWTGKGSEPGLSIEKSTQFMVVRSIDHGNSWSQPENWTEALKDPRWYLFAPAPGNGITMSNGRLVLPTQGRDATGLPFSNLTFSDDGGKTWQLSKPARTNTTECAVAELSDGTLMLNMRDNRNRRQKGDDNGRAVAVTDDLGQTWAEHSSDHSALPEPTCMASLIRVASDGKTRLFFSNPRNKHRRAGMTIQVSNDDGATWPKQKHVLLDSKGGAYSSLVLIDENTLGILYESSVADMVFQKIKLDEFD